MKMDSSSSSESSNDKDMRLDFEDDDDNPFSYDPSASPPREAPAAAAFVIRRHVDPDAASEAECFAVSFSPVSLSPVSFSPVSFSPVSFSPVSFSPVSFSPPPISDIRIQGCFFHLAQSVHRKLCALGFQARYGTDEAFAVKMKMLPALAFLPVEAIPEAFQDLLEVFPQEAIGLANYFEDVYVGRPRRNGVSSAQFPPKLWSVYEAALDGIPRTNNSVGTWHYGLQSNVRSTSPNIWVFFDSLKKEQALSEMKLSQAASGVTATRVSRKQEAFNKRLQRILGRYDGTDNMDILEACARSITL
ncbi:uncharacterized protein ISCGN_026584 [Ixodes scapularis]